MTIEQRVMDQLRRLPAGEQQEVLDFVKFLASKVDLRRPETDKPFISLAEAYIGVVDGGPGDLSTNKKHLEGYGT